MKHFIVRNQQIQIYNEVDYFKTDITQFSEFESTFSLPINISQVEYYPGILYELRHYNGKVETLEPANFIYDNYIEKVGNYLLKQKEIEAKSFKLILPNTLPEAKLAVISSIYQYASGLTEELVRRYAPAERDRWASVILPEAEAYFKFGNVEDAPNLTAQEIIRTGLTDTTSTEFKDSLLKRVNGILEFTPQINANINRYSGVRGKWVDTVNSFEQTKFETEEEAIKRLLDLNWKQGWD